MIFCKNCGTKLPEGSNFCTNCETPITKSQKDTEKVLKKFKKFLKDSDVNFQFAPEDISRNKDKAYLSYMTVLAVIPGLTSAEDSPYIRFHANQGICLAIAEVIVMALLIIARLLTNYFYAQDSEALILPMLGLQRILLSLTSIFFIFSIVGFSHILSGKAYKFPLFGKFDILGKFYK